MENKIENIFAKASRKDKFLTEEKRQLDGAKKFKRKALGFFKYKTTKTLDEMAELLYQTGIASSLEEGRIITPSLIDQEIKYSSLNYIEFEEVKDRKGNTKYLIRCATSSMLF